MDLKIGVKRILYGHFETFKTNKGEVLGWDVVCFLLLPAIVSGILLYYKIYLKTDYLNIFISALSIFVGLLFNVIVVMFDIAKKDKIRRAKLDLIRDVVINISFAILTSVLAILTSLLTQIELNGAYKIVSNFINYFLLINFVLTLLMILKRMYVVFVDELEDMSAS